MFYLCDQGTRRHAHTHHHQLRSVNYFKWIVRCTLTLQICNHRKQCLFSLLKPNKILKGSKSYINVRLQVKYTLSSIQSAISCVRISCVRMLFLHASRHDMSKYWMFAVQGEEEKQWEQRRHAEAAREINRRVQSSREKQTITSTKRSRGRLPAG